MKKGLIGVVFLIIFLTSCGETPLFPSVHISSSGIRTLEKEDGYVPAEIEFLDENGNSELLDPDAKVKIRGNSTADGPKKPYGVKLSEKEVLLGDRKAKKWNLLADSYDPTMMRNVLALSMAKELGLTGTPDYERTDLYLNDRYQGLYLLTESMSTAADRLELNPENGDFLLEMETREDEDEKLLRTDEEDHYFETGLGIRFRVRSPEGDEEGAEDLFPEIERTMEELEALLQNGSYEEIGERIDLTSFTSHYLLNEYLWPVDYRDLSVFFYYKNGKFYAGPVWDYDLSAGNISEEFYGSGADSSVGAIAADCHYDRLLWQYPAFRKEAMEEFEVQKELFLDTFSEGGFLDREYTAYRDAIERNYRKWDVSEAYSPYERIPDDTYEENLLYLRDWLSHRYEWMEEYLQQQTGGE